jgi:hypothetical protein
MWYYCLAGKGTMDITHEWCPKITSGDFFFKKSYLSLSTDYTYKFLVNR